MFRIVKIFCLRQSFPGCIAFVGLPLKYSSIKNIGLYCASFFKSFFCSLNRVKEYVTNKDEWKFNLTDEW